jgi:hypothetical protein
VSANGECAEQNTLQAITNSADEIIRTNCASSCFVMESVARSDEGSRFHLLMVLVFFL